MKPTTATSNIGRRRQAAQKEGNAGYTARRGELIKIAADVFRAKGYDAVRMDDVAEQLGIDRATLYYYFGNKHQLFRMVVAEAVQETAEAARAIADGEGTAAEKVRRLLVDLFDSYHRHYPVLYVYLQEDMHRLPQDDSPESKLLIDLGNRYYASATHIIEEGIANGEFHPDLRPSLTAQALIGATSWSHRWYSPEGPLTGAEIGEHFSRLFLHGMLVDGAPRPTPDELPPG